VQGVSLPAAQTLPNYAALALVYGSVLLFQRRKPHHGALSYAAVSLLDVEGNFLVVRSACESV
jgi:solute carrier family 35 protein F1/2